MGSGEIISLVLGSVGLFSTAMMIVIKSGQSGLKSDLKDVKHAVVKLTNTCTVLDKNVAVLSRTIDMLDGEMDRVRDYVKEKINDQRYS
jgi:hypothetical protein